MPGGNYLAAGIEHDESGAPTVNGEMHARMNDKRLAKFEPLKARRDLFTVEGDADAAMALISWGSVAGIAVEALDVLRAGGLNVKLLIPRLLYPIAEAVFADFFRGVERCLVVEQSHQGQLHRLIRMWVDVPAMFRAFAKSGANPITPDEVVEQVRSLAGGEPRRRPHPLRS
jgi:2-oxoglutarate ferredoxin oxidoreductase subunit alpha